MHNVGASLTLSGSVVKEAGVENRGHDNTVSLYPILRGISCPDANLPLLNDASDLLPGPGAGARPPAGRLAAALPWEGGRGHRRRQQRQRRAPVYRRLEQQ